MVPTNREIIRERIQSFRSLLSQAEAATHGPCVDLDEFAKLLREVDARLRQLRFEVISTLGIAQPVVDEKTVADQTIEDQDNPCHCCHCEDRRRRRAGELYAVSALYEPIPQIRSPHWDHRVKKGAMRAEEAEKTGQALPPSKA